MNYPHETKVIVQHSAAGAGANGEVVPCAGLATVAVQVFGTVTSATLYFEGTIDGYTWVGLLGWNRNTGVKALSTTAAGLFVVNVTGLTAYRTRLDWTSGSVDVVARGTELPITTLVTAS